MLEKIKNTFKNVSSRNGSYSVGMIALVIAIVVVVNLIAGQLPENVKSIDVSDKKIYQISKGIIDSSSLPNAEAMYYHLKMQQRKNKIPADLPEGVQTANKTGELDTVENDAAIIYDTAKGIDLVICFMSQDLTDTGAAQSTIAADARAIYGYYNE